MKDSKSSWLSVVVVFFIVVAIATLPTIVYRAFIISKSEFRYTVVKFTDNYHTGKSHGKKIHYSINRSAYESHCGSNECRNARIGDIYLIKVYLDDPDVFEILFFYKVNPEVVVPDEGWLSVPKFPR